MNYDEFINTFEGKAVDYDGSAGVQCVDLIKLYLEAVFGIKQFPIGGSARFYFEDFEDFKQLSANFAKIKNTKTFIPQKGDVCVWGSAKGGGHGHVAIASGNGTTKYFYSYDQNYNGKACHYQYHDYAGFLGVLRPKDQSKILQLVFYPAYTGSSKSFADALKQQKINGSFTFRAKIAKANGVSGYIGTAAQNTKLFNLYKRGELIKPKGE